ncbi:MAG: sensor signal transduction histidine kinase [Deferribacteraceae bacterium]|jgi:PAS domain S-box-containing protein|nr:sensor signal transduction histidine kinase [Deferribacteraceae bacterium]
MERLFKLFELAELLSDAVFIHDFEKFIYVNEVACKYLGYSKDEIIGHKVSKIVHSNKPGFLEDIIRKIKEEGQLKFLSKHLSKFGEIIDVEVSVKVIEFDKKEYAISLVRNISNKIRREQTNLLRLNLYLYAKEHTINEILTFVLDAIEKILNSKISFLHFVESDQKTLSFQAWSTATKEKFCNALPENYHYDVDKAGIWADCVRYKKSFIHNDYQNIENKKGLPYGHAEVVRELVNPVIRGDNVVAIIGVGNKPFDYTDSDVRTLEYLADIVWEVIEKKRLEEKVTDF